MNKPFHITALGEILIDFTEITTNDGSKAFEKNPGGAPANLLATISKFGGKTAFIGKVGKDMFGDFLKGVLNDCRINTDGLVIDDVHNTTLAFVALDDHGDRSFSFYRNFGADTFLEKNQIDTDIIKASEMFHFGSLSLTCEPSKSATDYALKTAKENGCIITFDPNYRELLWNSSHEAVSVIREYLPYANIVKLSMEELIMITDTRDVRKGIDCVLSTGVAIALVTDGENGVYYGTADYFGFLPSIKANTIDTTGAGDIFFGTFLYEFINGEKSLHNISKTDMEKYVKKAVEIAGISTETRGGIPSIPSYN